MEPQQRDFLILYGTQTNTAQYAAEEMGRECLKRGYRTDIMQMDSFTIFNLPTEKLVVFIIATTGEGEPPTTMQNSWRFLLRQDLPPTSLQNVNFAIFGLGDSSYELFNAMAKKLMQRLLDLGANLVHQVGLGDYQHDFEYQGEFDPWLEGLWPKLGQFVPEKSNALASIDQNSNLLLPSIYKVEILGMLDDKGDNLANLIRLPPPHGALSPQVHLSKVLENENLTSADHFQDTRKIILDLQSQSPGQTLDYIPGDIIMIQPKNNEKEVLEFIDRLGLNKNQLVRISIDEQQLGQASRQSLIAFPEEGITIYELFSYWINLMEPPSRYFMYALSHFTDDEMLKDKLVEFSSKSAEGKSEYYRYAVREKRTIFEVLNDFQKNQITLPLEYLIQLCGRQKPREFSISSALNKYPGQAHLTMAVTEYETQFKRLKKGVCSYWLKSQLDGEDKSKHIQDSVPVWLKKGTMVLPADKNTPIIMVGPGTGLAAFRAFIHHLGVAPDNADQNPQLVLIFGCRSKDKDCYYEKEWQQFSNLKVITAFSRDQADGSKQYVQHVIRHQQNAAYLADLIIQKQAHIYVSGRAKYMPKSVERAFGEIITAHANQQGSPIDGPQFIQMMKKSKKYQQEVW